MPFHFRPRKCLYVYCAYDACAGAVALYALVKPKHPCQSTLVNNTPRLTSIGII